MSAFYLYCNLLNLFCFFDLPSGDPEVLYNSVHQKIFTLPEDFCLFPAHDYKGIVIFPFTPGYSKTTLGDIELFTPIFFIFCFFKIDALITYNLVYNWTIFIQTQTFPPLY